MRPGAAAALSGRRAGRERIAWGLVAVALLLAAASFLRSALRVEAPARPMHLSVMLPEKSALRAAVISPDGTSVVVVAKDASGKNLLWIRALDSPVVQALAGTENPSFPFWSPDSRFIGFFADGKLKKMAASGGPAQALSD